MKVFRSIQADCALLGIESSKLRKKHEVNLKSSIIFSTYIFGTVSCGYYLICIDKPFEQYIKSYYTTTSFLVCILQFMNLFWQMPKLTDFFLKMGDFVQQREWMPKLHLHFFIHSNQKANNILFDNYNSPKPKFRTKPPPIEGNLQQNCPLRRTILSNHWLIFHKNNGTNLYIAPVHCLYVRILFCHRFTRRCIRVALFYVVR